MPILKAGFTPDGQRGAGPGEGLIGWIEAHGPLIFGIFAAIAAGWYLLTSGKGGGATTISQPQPSGGGPVGGGPGGTAPTTTSGYLPYSPDTSILSHLSDMTLEGLYNQLFNAEAGANVAYSQGNTSLFNQMQAAISNLQSQIAGYVPATPPPTPPPTPPSPAPTGPTPAVSAVNNTASVWQQTLGEITNLFGGVSNGFTNVNVGSPFATGWITTVAQTFQVPTEVAQNVYSAIIQNPQAFRPPGVTGGSQWDYGKIANTLQGQVQVYNAKVGAK